MAGGGATTLGYLGGNTANAKPERFTPSQVVEYGGARYVVFIDNSSDLVYRKSATRGKSWGSEVVIHASTVRRTAGAKARGGRPDVRAERAVGNRPQ